MKAAQAFRPHVLDKFEPQDHPNDFQYPGGLADLPLYDSGLDACYQMGVKFDRILDGFEVLSSKSSMALANQRAGKAALLPKAAGFQLSPTNQ
ncbi:MAG: hypothetical protein IPL01_05995 [Acidobacteria bacterium]|nr:hypothetical protein [Acidobacteriota bacterium]